MTQLLLEIVELLGSPAGNMAYHLVISFTLLGVLSIAIPHTHKNNLPGNRRAVFLLATLVILRISLFIIFGLRDQNVINYPSILPEISRGFDVLNLLILFGLFGYSFDKTNKRKYSSFTWLTIGFTGLLIVFLWISYSPPIDIDSNLFNGYSNLFIILAIYIGITFISYRQSNNWILGILMFSLLFIGEVGQTTLFSNQSNYPYFARLLHLAAFPLLFGLRFSVDPDSLQEKINDPTAKTKETTARKERETKKAEILSTLLKNNSEYPEKALSQYLAYTFLADIILILSPPQNEDQSSILSGYDLIQGKQLAVSLAKRFKIPEFSNCYKKLQVLKIPSDKSDLSSLAKTLQIKDLGNAVIIPIKKTEANFCILMANPYTKKKIKESDLDTILSAADQFNKFFAGKPLSNDNDIELLINDLNEFSDLALRYENENKLLLEEISSIKERSEERLQDEIEKWKNENSEINSKLKEINKVMASRADIEKELSSKLLETELNNSHASRTYFAIITEIKEKMSAIIDSSTTNIRTTPTLLDLNKSISTLSFFAKLESSELKVNSDIVKLPDLIDDVLSQCSGPLRDKKISLRVKLPENLPQIISDRQILEEIFSNLIRNSISSSPLNEEIFIKAIIKSNSEIANSVRIEISDSGEGISEKDLDRLFSPSQMEIAQPILGSGNIGLSLPIAKLLTKKIEGHLSAKSEIGNGTTFALVLPNQLSDANNSEGK